LCGLLLYYLPIKTKGQQMTLQTRKNWLLAALILAALGVLGGMDAESEQHNESEYCAMVSIWKQDEANGIAKSERAGWPPFKGEEMCK
jgi:hypothetical protein